jgi:TolB-like protein/DNA-binding winged helix-turn-helix (wHTH) protein/Tfp pilus assembly protein PilF
MSEHDDIVGPARYQLAQLTIEPDLNQLVKDGESIHLEPTSMDVLVYLIENARRVVPAGELLERFWADSIVEESTIHRRIAQIRQALGDNARHPIYIETVLKRGYRVIAEVRRLGPEESEKSERPEALPDKEGTLSSSQIMPSRSSFLALGLALLVIAVGAFGFSALVGDRSPEQQQTSDPIPSGPKIAVLPFRDFSSAADNAYLASGFHEDILTKLAAVDGLQVTSRTSVERYAGEKETPQIGVIARELGVSHVLEGSVRRDGDQLRLTVQLIEASTDGHLWAETYDRDLGDLFAVQSEVASEVASQLSLELNEEAGGRLAAVPTRDLEAYDLVLKARVLIRSGTTESLAEAETLLEAARRRDPRLAEAHASFAQVLLLQTIGGREWADVREAALAASQTALDIDPGSSKAHLTRAHLVEVWEQDPDSATRHYLRALELDPNNSEAWLHHGAFLGITQGRPEEALPYLERARALDPLSGEVHFYLAVVLRTLGRVDEASEVLRAGLRVEPDDIDLIFLEHSMLFASGEMFAALDRLPRLFELDPTTTRHQLAAVYVMVILGEIEAAQRWVDRMALVSPTHLNTFLARLHVYGLSSDSDALAALLEEWRILNSDRRAQRVDDGMATPFGIAAQVVLLSQRAREARANGSRDAELALRSSAVERMGDVLLDEKGEIRITSANQLLAIEHASNLLVLGRQREAREVLLAIRRDANPTDEFQTATLFVALALLGDVEDALDFAEATTSKPHLITTLDWVKDDYQGLFPGWAENPRFAAFYDEVTTKNRVIRERLHRELPELISAEAGF